MKTILRPRTVLNVSRNPDGDVEISLVTGFESPAGEEKCAIVLQTQDVPFLLKMLERIVAEDDPEDRSTLRNVRPVRTAPP